MRQIPLRFKSNYERQTFGGAGYGGVGPLRCILAEHTGLVMDYYFTPLRSLGFMRSYCPSEINMLRLDARLEGQTLVRRRAILLAQKMLLQETLTGDDVTAHTQLVADGDRNCGLPFLQVADI
jgi:hypothetical protein